MEEMHLKDREDNKGGGKLNIITCMRPDEAENIYKNEKPAKKIGWRILEHPGRKEQKPRREISFGERLVRNSAIACALLLGILAVGNIEQPWAKNTIGKVEQALTMKLDVDEAFGGLQLVQNLMPEAVLTFFNVSGGDEFAMPVEGTVKHGYSQTQPWLIFETDEGCDVCAVADGTISAVSELSGGGYGILIDHGNGIETLYAYLYETSVSGGDQVTRGSQLGTLSEDGGMVYFEMRENGEPVDPSEKLGL